MFSTYAIYNPKHNKIYIGQTDDTELRLKKHNLHFYKNSFTSRFDGEWHKIYEEKFGTRAQAIKREKELKSQRGRLFLKTFIPA